MNAQKNTVKNIKIAFLLNLSFTVIELVGGLLTNSLAILSDALHDFSDSVSLAMSLYLETKSEKRRTAEFSYGYRRLSLFSALISSTILIAGSIFVILEAIPRIFEPQHSNAQGMLGLAILGIAVNTIAALRTRRGKSLNQQMITWHLMEDVFGWVAVLVTSLVMLVFDFHMLDPLLSLGITTYVLWNVFKKLKVVLKIFLQAVPQNISVKKIENGLKKIPKVAYAHDTHVWSLDGENHVLSTHLVVRQTSSAKELMEIKCKAKELISHFGIEHATVELEQTNESCNLKNH